MFFFSLSLLFLFLFHLKALWHKALNKYNYLFCVMFCWIVFLAVIFYTIFIVLLFSVDEFDWKHEYNGIWQMTWHKRIVYVKIYIFHSISFHFSFEIIYNNIFTKWKTLQFILCTFVYEKALCMLFMNDNHDAGCKCVFQPFICTHTMSICEYVTQ